MSSRYISDNLRSFIALRANHRCEYCRITEQYAFFGFHVEHIISLKHGGKTEESNLAYACPICNTYKGTDIATLLPGSNELVRFFYPRMDQWNEHFMVLPTGEIQALSSVGIATINILRLNQPDAIIERRLLLELGIF
ncbi:MAG: HNH endonuclease [Chitinophagales bacterium]|nr:HNH endonuclease [Chitinophagales bacterium]